MCILITSDLRYGVIEPNAFGAIGAIINFMVATVVSKMTAEPPQETQALLATAINDTYYYGEASTLFTHYEVGFPQPKN
ncbi:MAG: hypothetical protein ACJA0C_001207 [Candidatus Endobugula sp.]